MKGNPISIKTLNESGVFWLQKTMQLLQVQEYGKGSVRNYIQELTLLFKHFNDLKVEDLKQEHIERYLIFIKENHKVGRAKCRSVAQACSFFFKKVMPSAYIVPSNLYPKKQFILPDIMTEIQVEQLFRAALSLKERCVVGLLYGCGLRISEVCNLRIQDIDSANKRIKVEQGKGGKDRFTLLPPTLLGLNSICEQLKISPPPAKVKLPVVILSMLKFGIDIGLCTLCKTGRIERMATYINISQIGVELVEVEKLRNRGSPKKIQKSAL